MASRTTGTIRRAEAPSAGPDRGARPSRVRRLAAAKRIPEIMAAPRTRAPRRLSVRRGARAGREGSAGNQDDEVAAPLPEEVRLGDLQLAPVLVLGDDLVAVLRVVRQDPELVLRHLELELHLRPGVDLPEERLVE